MAENDLTLGEVQRNLERHEREMQSIRSDINNLARESVTVTQFGQEMTSLRRELAGDRAQQEALARERHNATIARLDRMEKTTNDRFGKLEQVEASRGMNVWTRVGILGTIIVGSLGGIAGLIAAIHH